MNSLTTIVPNRAPVPMGRDLSTLVGKFKNRLEAQPGPFRHYSICERLAPTDVERSVLVARRQALTNALQPGPADAHWDAIIDLRTGFQTGAVDVASAASTVEVYLKALEPFPGWAVTEACARFRDGRNATAWRPAYCPTTAEVAAECRVIIGPVRDELTSLADILDAATYPEPDPDLSSRMAAVMDWEKEGLGNGRGPGRKVELNDQEARQHAADTLRNLRTKRAEPVTIGQGLRGKLEAMGATFNEQGK